MRVLVLVLLFVVGWSPAHAEKAKAKEDAKIYNRAGEQGQVVIKVKEGQVMRIDRKEGRWYKVRVSGRTGWIPRTKVELLGEEEMARNTRRRPFVDGRSVKRGFGGGSDSGPDDRIGEDAITTNDDVKKGSGKTKPSKGGEDDEDDTEDDDDDDTAKKPTPAKSGTKPKPTPKGGDEDDTEDDTEDTGDTEGDEPKGGDDDEPEVKDTRPKARVKKKTVVLAEADSDSEESFTATPDMTLFPTGKKKGKYIEVETDDGDIGFVLADSVETTGGGDDEDDDDEGGGRGGRMIDVRGRLGVSIIKQGMRATGGATAPPDNYDLSTSAATVALGGSYLRPYGKSYMIGGELSIDLMKAVPGVSAPMDKTTGITIYNVNARAMFGKDFKRKSGMIAFGRLGFRYYSYQVSNVGNLMENTAMLPSEIIKAPTLGASLALPKLTEKIGLRFSIDTMLVGASMQQTKGIEDGQKASSKGLFPGIGFTYRWKPSMDINAAYDLAYTKYAFGAPLAGSMRHAGATDSNRTDLFHSVTVGVAKAF